jgi:hypothetical protein
MAYVGDKLVEITENARNDPSVRKFIELADNYIEHEFRDSDTEPPKSILSFAEKNQSDLIKAEIAKYCESVGIGSVFFSYGVPKGMDYVVIQTDKEFNLEALTGLVPFLKDLKEKDFVYRVAHNIYSKDGDPEGVYSLYILPDSAFREAQAVGTEERLRAESIYADSDGQLSFPKGALSINNQREIIDTLAEKLFGLKETK